MFSQAALTEDEFEKLEQFLLNVPDLDESMDIATLDGFLTAIVIGPKTVMPSEWMRWVWDMEAGEDSHTFDNMAQAEEIMGLLMRHMNDISNTLNNAPEKYQPVFMVNHNKGDPILVIDEWCYGFMKGVNLDSAGWLPIKAGHPDWLSTIVLYGTVEEQDNLEKKNLSLDAHRAHVGGVANNVRDMHEFWRKDRVNLMASGGMLGVMRREPIRNPDKVGRNEVCPCGSGKKYKRCHGEPSKLH